MSSPLVQGKRSILKYNQTSTLPRHMGVEKLVHLHSHRVLVHTLYGSANLELGWVKSKNTTGNQGGFWTFATPFHRTCSRLSNRLLKLGRSLQELFEKVFRTDKCSITPFWISSSKSKRRQMHCNMIACRRNRVVDFLSPGHNANSIALHEYPTVGTSREKRRNFSASSSPCNGP
jgi:hypothetical protein